MANPGAYHNGNPKPKIQDGAKNETRCMTPKPPNKVVQHPRDGDGVVRGGFK
jgi:hypothetical protein